MAELPDGIARHLPKLAVIISTALLRPASSACHGKITASPEWRVLARKTSRSKLGQDGSLEMAPVGRTREADMALSRDGQGGRILATERRGQVFSRLAHGQSGLVAGWDPRRILLVADGLRNYRISDLLTPAWMRPGMDWSSSRGFNSHRAIGPVNMAGRCSCCPG